MLSQFWGLSVILMFPTKPLTVKCCRKNIAVTTAYIRTAKSTVVGTNNRTFVKARVETFQEEDQQQSYRIKNMYVNDLNNSDIKVDH